ncbi:PIN domain-containing protein [Allomuricauda sp. d1]|uniref:PIN domain-containing protein n=1 Tax=Allomuricauda sp. d1 TaxID=3136725 RepID=UPI0031D0DB36
MNKKAIQPYRLSEEKEARLWANAEIIFDSSALLDFYFLPKTARKKISIEVFKKLKDRLWLPHHVQYEYLKNREKTIRKPIEEKYKPLRQKIQKIGFSANSQILKKIEEIKRETFKDDKHPHLDQSHLDKFKENTEQFLAHSKTFEEEILKAVETIEKEIQELEDNDDVLSTLEKYFKVGREYSFEEIIEITKEGKHRYEFKIPPGYGDFYGKEKKGTQIFGDLIIWKQILEYAKENQKPIIFITNDIAKDNDWCYRDTKATEPRILSPREELIKEIKDFSGVEFWMYNWPQFLYESNKRLQSTIQEETIQNLFQFIGSREVKGNSLKFKCNNCSKIQSFDKSDFDLNFEFVGSSDRSMGAENQYVAEEELNCGNCSNPILVKFGVWEYPVGAHNYDDVEIEGAELLDSFHFTIDFHEDDHHDFITCQACSGNRDGVGNFVRMDGDRALVNEYPPDHPKGKYDSVTCGHCDWCNTIHIVCPDCTSINEIEQFRYDENIECEGGCGLVFNADSSNDRENLGEFDLKLMDDRVKHCESCGENFIDESNTGICEECENAYNEN